MPLYWPTGSTIPTWVTSTLTAPTLPSGWLGAATTSTTNSPYYSWLTNGTAAGTASAMQQVYGLQNQTYATQAVQAHAYQRYAFQLYQPVGLGSLGALAAPALITHQEQARRDQELYRRALAEHDDQEAGRLLRQIEARELAAADRQRLIEQEMQQQREDQRRRAAASDRAGELLLEHLTPQQRETYANNGWFVVEGGRTKTKYRIRGGTLVANIDVLDRRDRSTHRLCGHAQSHIPMGDQLLAQKIMLELAEDDFLLLANRHAA